MRLAIVSLLTILAIWQAEGCCLPEKFSTDFNLVFNATGEQGDEKASVTALFNEGKIYLDASVNDLYLRANGFVIINTNKFVLPMKMDIEMAVDEGESLWVKTNVDIPGVQQAEHCIYVKIEGDIPEGYRCYFDSLEKLPNDEDGNRVFQARTDELTDTVTVDSNCVMSKEEATLTNDVVSITLKARYSNTQIGTTEDINTKRPSKCQLKDTIKLPRVEEGGPTKLLAEEMNILQTSRRAINKRNQSIHKKRAIDSIKQTLHRVARQAFNEFIAEFKR